MLRNFILAALACGSLMSMSAQSTELNELNPGDKAPSADLKMTNIDGQDWSLVDLAGENGVLVMFSCNTCPFVVGREGKSEGWEGRYNDVATLARENGIGSVLVNSNEAKRKGDDSLEEMKLHALEAGYIMPYVVDVNHKLADAFGARTTPHVYLFDKDFRLVYKGAIDDNVNAASEVEETYLKDAIQRMAEGKKVKPAVTKAIGCSIKRVG
ncbi:MAG: thioredoxin family protein [Flavobacteriales bacterium]|nr:thioredoxin family protein [Flavobacteriales bacterium]